MRSVFVLALVCAAGAACGGEENRAPTDLVGVIVDIQTEKASLLSFTLDAGGETHGIFIAKDVDYGFGLLHLYEHRATGDPIRCILEERGERHYALEIVDA